MATDWKEAERQGYENHQIIVEALRADPEALIAFAADRLVALGALSEWDLDDNFSVSEGLVQLATAYYNLPSAGDQSEEELTFYGKAAYAVGHHSEWQVYTEITEQKEEA